MSDEAARPQAETRKTIRTFAVASFLNDMGSDIISPVWPLFVTQVLKANMAALGFLDGLGEAVVSLSQAVRRLLFGQDPQAQDLRLDRLPLRRRLAVRVCRLVGLAAPCPLPHPRPRRQDPQRPARRHASPTSRPTPTGAGISACSGPWTISAPSTGILISIALFNVLGYRLLFALAAIPSVLGALLVLKNIREPKEPRARVFKGLSFRDIDRNLALYIILNGVFALGAFTYSFLLIIRQVRRVQGRLHPRPLPRLLGHGRASLLPLRAALGPDRAQAGDVHGLRRLGRRLRRGRFLRTASPPSPRSSFSSASTRRPWIRSRRRSPRSSPRSPTGLPSWGDSRWSSGSVPSRPPSSPACSGTRSADGRPSSCPSA